MTLPAGLRALAHANFRLYFAGQAISILGSWIQQVALAWLVYRLTGSAALLGITAFCGLIPQLVVGPFAGAFIDRQDKKRGLILVQSLMALQAFVLAGLTWLDWINTPFIVVMALLLGVLSSFDAPLRQSLIGTFVGHRDDLPNALALNAMLFNAGRFVGPPIAGLLLGLTSEAACFALNGFSFLALAVWFLPAEALLPAMMLGALVAGVGGPFFFVPMITRMQTVFHGHDIARVFRLRLVVMAAAMLVSSLVATWFFEVMGAVATQLACGLLILAVGGIGYGLCRRLENRPVPVASSPDSIGE